MIVLNVTYRCRPGMRDRFLEAITAEGIDQASRAETGNLKYDYYLPAAGGDELLLVEKWKGTGAIAEHMGQAHYLRLKALKETYVDETVIERFETDRV